MSFHIFFQIFFILYVRVCVTSVAPGNQRLRAGFPPKELKAGSEPNLPVQLANGERVQVDIVNVQKEKASSSSAATKSSSSTSSAALASAQNEAEKGEHGVSE